MASELPADRTITHLTVVAPTEHLKYQWSEAAAAVGIALDPEFRHSTGGTSSDYTGIAVTYAGSAPHRDPPRHGDLRGGTSGAS